MFLHFASPVQNPKSVCVSVSLIWFDTPAGRLGLYLAAADVRRRAHRVTKLVTAHFSLVRQKQFDSGTEVFVLSEQ
jgi:hypothetical protein